MIVTPPNPAARPAAPRMMKALTMVSPRSGIWSTACRSSSGSSASTRPSSSTLPVTSALRPVSTSMSPVNWPGRCTVTCAARPGSAPRSRPPLEHHEEPEIPIAFGRGPRRRAPHAGKPGRSAPSDPWRPGWGTQRRDGWPCGYSQWGERGRAADSVKCSPDRLRPCLMDGSSAASAHDPRPRVRYRHHHQPRSMTAPAVVSWAARLGWLHLESTPLAFLGHAVTPGVRELPRTGRAGGRQAAKTPSQTTIIL